MQKELTLTAVIEYTIRKLDAHGNLIEEISGVDEMPAEDLLGGLDNAND